MTMPDLQLDAAGVSAFIASVWPQAAARYGPSGLVHLDASSARMRMLTSDTELRPGGTVSGPTMMQLADSVTYALVLGLLGDAALAVTTHLSIDFVRRPEPGELVADAQLKKLGRSLIVMSVDIFSVAPGAEPIPSRPVAVASVTYSRSLV
jgi:uncharacterized protein (TIGR00369 family)